MTGLSNLWEIQSQLNVSWETLVLKIKARDGDNDDDGDDDGDCGGGDDDDGSNLPQ